MVHNSNVGDGDISGFTVNIGPDYRGRCGIKTITVVNNNGCLGQCLDGINRAYGNRTGKREEMCMFSNIDFAKIAQAMGCFGIRVENPGEISAALKKALQSERPAVVDVATDMNSKAPSPWTPS